MMLSFQVGAASDPRDDDLSFETMDEAVAEAKSQAAMDLIIPIAVWENDQPVALFFYDMEWVAVPK